VVNRNYILQNKRNIVSVVIFVDLLIQVATTMKGFYNILISIWILQDLQIAIPQFSLFIVLLLEC